MSDRAVTLVALGILAAPVLTALLWHAWDAWRWSRHLRRWRLRLRA